MTMRVVLIRHGETEWTMSGRHTGLRDIPLTAEGRADAKALASMLSRFRFELVLTSPASRARETCEIAGYSERAILEPDLLEWDYGIYEGRTTSEIRGEIANWSVWTHEMIGGESLEALGERCDRVIEHIITVPGDVALFGHGHALRVLAVRWLGQSPALGEHLVLETAAISILGYERESPAITLWNHVGQLGD